MAVEPDIVLLYGTLAYLIILLGVGFWAYKKVETMEDFMLAGRGLGTVVIAGTLMATWMGSGTVTGGNNSIAYSFGLSPALLFSVTAPLGIGIMYLLRPKIRELGADKLTIPGMLEKYIGREGKAIGLLIIAIAFIGITSYQFTGLGFVLHVTTGISVYNGTLIGMIVIIALAAMGGLMSVSYTDALSAFIMLFGLLFAVPFVYSAAGGWTGVISSMPETNLTLDGGLGFLGMLGYMAPLLLLLLGDQNMYQRILAGKDDKETSKGMIGWFIGVAAGTILVALIAFGSRALFPDIDPGMALIATTTVIPRILGIFLLAGASAFIITTGNSYLLSASTNISQDLYRGFINPEASDKKVFWLTRILVIVLGLTAWALGQYFPTILSVQMYAYTMYGATITPTILAVFLMRGRLTKLGGILGMVTGATVTIVWDIVLGSPYGLGAVIPAFPAAAVVLITVSLLQGKQKSEPSKPEKT